MNSEELEVSLRAEFENYLKNVLAEMKQEISQLQEKVTTEIERHKSQLDEVFATAQTNFEKELEIDAGFKESVVEHLRLSRDEGAQITAMAIAKAEELEKEKQLATPTVGIKEIYQAVNEISTKTTQSEILKTLVHHAADFAPRGAFFIVKNEHLVGWRVFGKEKGSAEENVREVFLSVSANSVLSNSVKSLATVNSLSGGKTDDAEVFQKLEFGAPDRMVAIPLVARGRGVAVLYADYGNEGGEVNIEALETLVRVAGLTVEVLASAKTVSKKPTISKKAEASFAEAEFSPKEFAVGQGTVESFVEPTPSFVSTPVIEPSFESSNYVAPTPVEDFPDTTDFVVDNSQIAETQFETYEPQNFAPESPVEFESAKDSYSAGFEISRTIPEPQVEEPQVEEESYVIEEEKYPAFETTPWSSSSDTTPGFSAQEFAQNFAKETDPTEYAKEYSYQAEPEIQVETETTASPVQEYQFETSNSYQEATTEPLTAPAEEFVPTKEQTYGSFDFENGKTETVEVTQPLSTPPVKSRLSERNVDLPIEVTEDERRLHNDARRFARLLVSEIKLYNEQKVKEGRDSSDLYDRLKEAIDRSREMYDKRVQPPVAAKFDYFHYELVNTLAEGDDNKLGAAYPGSAI